jgi:AcrR family transcriptional regulator
MAVKHDEATPGGPPRVRNPQGQGGRLRVELIAAADRILAETGDVEGLSLRAVARAVGIATPSIYLHFPDKRALVQAVLAERFAQLGEAVQAAVGAATSPGEQLLAGCLAYCRFATEHPNAYRVLFGRASSRSLGLPPPANSVEVGATTFAMLVEGVAACIRSGAAPPGDPTRVATSLWTALHGIVTLRASLPRFPWPSLEQQVQDAIVGLVRLHHNEAAATGE